MGIIQLSKHCFRGPRPTDLRALRVSYDIDTIIDLESGVYDLINGAIPQFPPDFGMAYYHLPCSDVTPPSSMYVAKAIDLMSNQDRRTYVHCLSGVDRTGFVCAVFRARVQKWSYEDALAEWIKLGRHPWYFWWTMQLKKEILK